MYNQVLAQFVLFEMIYHPNVLLECLANDNENEIVLKNLIYFEFRKEGENEIFLVITRDIY